MILLCFERAIQSSDNGQLYIDAATKQQGNFGLEITQRSVLVQQKNEDYTTVVSNLTRLQELGPMETMATFAALQRIKLETLLLQRLCPLLC
jgi:DNA-binding helix-hairpin-helix protein with protein kinase domain